ncbi:hypothetical protein [Idiomarina abyssalis]|uniref:Uncharacterized protein n=1 Tax=Idiomarina abyssalis TaxID=86102 RepID=A0A8I1GDR0_9GAMM|nr:hypothetical protein [Idiomarina abyssalis]MBJ7266360.1 hypothetical protein [Idiomarina abyssalis]MBJ7316917.1 hypothetical protein [Idiomarina abyssalis]
MAKKASTQELRADLTFQLGMPEDLDWDYFVETAIRAKLASDEEGVNKPWQEEGRTVEEITEDAISLQGI